MVQSYDGFKSKTTFFVFFFSKACDKDTILRLIEGKAFRSVAKGSIVEQKHGLSVNDNPCTKEKQLLT